MASSNATVNDLLVFLLLKQVLKMQKRVIAIFMLRGMGIRLGASSLSSSLMRITCHNGFDK